MKTVKATCGKCDGSGKLSWTNVANGVCFVCGGVGHLVADESAIKAARWTRADVIAIIKGNLDRMAVTAEHYGCAFTFSDEPRMIGKALAHADADVHARALAALDRLGATDVDLANIRRDETDETANLVAGVRKVTRNVRRAG